MVTYLIDQGQPDTAECWAREGIEKTVQKWPGIASGLAESLCELSRRRKNWEIVAAHVAHKFFDFPSAEGFKELAAAAKKAKCEEQVRIAALHFLESGISPIHLSVSAKDHGKASIDPSWPLPVPEYLLPLLSSWRTQQASRPHYNVLLDMAIANKQPDNVLRWYDKMRGDKQRPHRLHDEWRWGLDADHVAKAVASTYPERALEIYRDKLQEHLPHTGDSAYEACVTCLRQMRVIYESLDKEDYWNELLADVRHNYRNRPRFMAMLDKLEGRTIVNQQSASVRRSRKA